MNPLLIISFLIPVAVIFLNLSGWVDPDGKISGEWSQIERNGMTLRWSAGKEFLDLEMRSPQQGWVAIGFNPRSGLKGTHLLMGRVQNGKAEVSDRTILAPGDHQAISNLGEVPWPIQVKGSESSSGTVVRFRLPLHRSDQWRHQLEAGRTYYVLMAFSRSDDFDHHSIMRTEVKITL